MSEKPKTQTEVRHERYFRRVKEIKVMGALAAKEIDDALAGNAAIISLIPKPELPLGDDAA